MTVSLIPNNPNLSEIDVSNATFFTMCNDTAIKDLIGTQSSNDSLDVDDVTAELFAESLDSWSPPSGWFMGNEENKAVEMFKGFFKACGGFKTN